MLSQTDDRLAGMEKELNQLSVVNCQLSIERIILHHSLTADGKSVSWDDIRRYHMSWAYEGTIITGEEAEELLAQRKTVKTPWRDVGYHFGIELIDKNYQILSGRMMTEEGAHCPEYQMNKKSLGICFVGNFDEVEPPREQWSLGLKFVRSLCEVFDLPKTSVNGHREHAPYKSCPGKKFDLERFRKEL